MLIEDRTNGFYASRAADLRFPPHLHHNMELMVCLEGVIGAQCAGISRDLLPGDAMIAFPTDIHGYLSGSGVGIMLIFDPRLLTMFEGKIASRRYENFVSSADASLTALASALYGEYRADGCFDILCGYANILVATMLKTLPFREASSGVRPELFEQALRYISENYTSPLSLDSLARRFGVDPCHLSRTFSQQIPCGFQHYVHQLRIEHAKRLLDSTNLDIYNVCCESGFTNPRSFDRVFKSVTGTTPSAYRRRACSV